MPLMLHAATGRTEDVADDVRVIQDRTTVGWYRVDPLIHTATGTMVYVSADERVQSGQGPEWCLRKERVIGSQVGRKKALHRDDECVSVFMRPRDWARLNDEEKHRLYLLPKTKPAQAVEPKRKEASK